MDRRTQRRGQPLKHQGESVSHPRHAVNSDAGNAAQKGDPRKGILLLYLFQGRSFLIDLDDGFFVKEINGAAKALSHNRTAGDVNRLQISGASRFRFRRRSSRFRFRRGSFRFRRRNRSLLPEVPVFSHPVKRLIDIFRKPAPVSLQIFPDRGGRDSLLAFLRLFSFEKIHPGELFLKHRNQLLIIITEHKAAHRLSDRTHGRSYKIKEVFHRISLALHSRILHSVDDKTPAHFFIDPVEPAFFCFPVNQLHAFIVPYEHMQYIKALKCQPDCLNMGDMRRVK